MCVCVDFGAVLLNMNSGEIEQRFQSYVRPTAFPHITPGCEQLTNTTQYMVDQSPKLKAVLQSFYRWVNNICSSRGVYIPRSTQLDDDYDYVIISTWSNYDLNIFLKIECAQKGITYANYLKYWANAKSIGRVSV